MRIEGHADHAATPPDPTAAMATHTPAASHAGTVARGTAMGLADIVPGVSGGTIALILGIHARLVAAIRALDWPLVRAVLQRRGGQEWRRADATFLVLLVTGIGIGILAGSILVTRALEAAPMATLAFFLGLIVASVPVPLRMMPTRTWREGVAFLIAAGLAFWVTVLDPVQAPTAAWFLPLAGAIAICAMILPGISGAFLLLLMGLYEPILHAIRHLDVTTLLLFGGGALLGILAFSRVLHQLLAARPGPTMAVLAGLMVGSLGRVWPFKDGDANVWPGSATDAGVALAAAVAGVGLAWLLARAGRQETT